MDPLLGRLAAPRSRRLVLILVALGAIVLVGAIVVAGLGASGSTAALPAVALTRAPSPSATPLLVQVTGAVRHPGVVSLPAGARTLDAVAAAGGATAAADEAGLNLVAPLADGQQVVVPRRGAVQAAPAATPGAAASTASGAKVSIGAADAEQLETLPRIGPALAARIIAWRAAHGGFHTVDDLKNVSGIGPKTFAGLRDLVMP